MFTIKSIRLRNFRAIKEANLEPLKNGITGIFGTNGAGKTTFLIGTLFALFGERPAGTTTAGLRREGSTYDEECSVSVVIEHLDQTVEILRQLKGKANSSELYIYVDGIEHTTTSIGQAEGWIRRRFGITADGFKTAFVVKQKELDSLVSAKPSERKSLIEKLAGIEDMNQAVKDVRKDENDIKKQLDILPGSQTEYEASKEAYETLQHKFDEINNLFTNSTNVLQKAEKNYDNTSSAYSSAKDKINYIESLKSRLKKKKDDLQDLNTRLHTAKQRLSGVKAEDVQRLKQEIVTLNNELETKREEYSTLRLNISLYEKSKHELEEKIQQAIMLPVVEKPLTSFEENETIVRDLETELQELRTEETTLSVRKKSLQENYDGIADIDECPTCHQPWKHSAEQREKIQKELHDIEKLLIIAINKKDNVFNKLNEAKTVLKESRQALQEYATYVSQQEQLETWITSLADLKLNAVTPEQLEVKKREGVLLGEQKDAKQTEFAEVSAALGFKKDVEELEEKIQILTDELPDLSETLAIEERNAPDISSIEQEVREARVALETERERFNKVNSDYSSFNVELNNLRNVYETHEKNWTKKRDIQRKYQELTAQTDILERFRINSISRLTPELSNYATSFISEMTSGAFTEIVLTDDFTINVVSSSGRERPASWLSGGEESAVALALRLAISFLITKENPQFLWLDEVLTAQDADRRSSMLNMIRRLEISQVLIINHSQEASDIVDRVVTIIPDTVNGSIISENKNS